MDGKIITDGAIPVVVIAETLSGRFVIGEYDEVNNRLENVLSIESRPMEKNQIMITLVPVYTFLDYVKFISKEKGQELITIEKVREKTISLFTISPISDPGFNIYYQVREKFFTDKIKETNEIKLN
jgi:hypothetical protein